MKSGRTLFWAAFTFVFLIAGFIELATGLFSENLPTSFLAGLILLNLALSGAIVWGMYEKEDKNDS